MRKRQDAPGELELVRQFVNTLDINPGTEELGAPGDLRSWLIEHGLSAADVKVGGADLRRAIELREALREILVAHTEAAPAPSAACRTLDEFSARARLRLSFDEYGGAAVKPDSAGVNAGLGRLLAIVHASIADGTWGRLKACRDHTCAWAFYDHTKNRSGTWCTMETCGNRAKARSYRDRRADATA